MSNFEHTLEQLTEGRKGGSKLKLPTNAATLTKKIRESDPWKIGAEFADMIEKNWDEIKAAGDRALIAKIPAVKEFADKHHLAVSNLLSAL